MNLRKFLPLFALVLISAIAIPASAATIPITSLQLVGNGFTFSGGLGSPESGADTTLSLGYEFASPCCGTITPGSGFLFLIALQLNESTISAAEAALSPSLTFNVTSNTINLTGLSSTLWQTFAAPTNAALYAFSPAFTLFQNPAASILARIVVTETDQPLNPSSVGSFDSIGTNGDIDYFWLQYTYQPIPEPGTIALMGFGLAALGLAARRRRQA